MQNNRLGGEPAADDKTKSARPTLLFRTCKQVYEEARQLFFAMNVFTIEALTPTIRYPMTASLVPWLELIGDENCVSLRHVIISHTRVMMHISDSDYPKQKKRLLRQMIELRSATKLPVECGIEVHIRERWTSPDLTMFHALPFHFTCDLVDLGAPWDKYIDALHEHVKSSLSRNEAERAERFQRMAEVLDFWRDGLKNA